MKSQEIAQLLLTLNCVKISPFAPFSYASGLKGPIYCDNRQILSHVNQRSQVVEAFIAAIQSKNISFDKVAGLATAGVPWAAIIADRIRSPLIYIRSRPKGHGLGNLIEGSFSAGEKVIIIEDLVNQGSSLDQALAGVQEAQLKTLACFSIVDYELKGARELQSKRGVPLFSLTNFTSLIKAGVECGKIDEKGHQLLLEWQRDPQGWSARL